MAHFHLFEIEDFSWYPKVLRDGQTDYLRFLTKTFEVFLPIAPLLLEAMNKTKQNKLFDFCSGGGGSVLEISNYLKKLGLQSFKTTLSDLYPNLEAFEFIQEQSNDEISYVSNSVNALYPPDETDDFWTIFNGFHHFRPEEAKQILKNAVDQNKAIGVFEPLDKSLWQWIVNTISLTLLIFIFMPFIRPFRWSRLFFTYLIPIIPLVTLWDGYVSILRLYTVKDMKKMVASFPNDYEWQIGKAKHGFGIVTYLIGIPKNI